MGKADLVRALSSLTAQPQSRSTHNTLSATSISESERKEKKILEENAEFPFNDSDVVEIESEGYPLYVLRTGYDCDVEYCSDNDIGVGKKDDDIESSDDIEKGNGNKSEKKDKASLYVHGSCSVQTKQGRVSVVFTAVPYDRALQWIASDAATCDLAVMVLHCSDLQMQADTDTCSHTDSYIGSQQGSQQDNFTHRELVISD